VECEAGTLVTFDPGERHALRGLDGARLLLTLAPWPAAGHNLALEGKGRLGGRRKCCLPHLPFCSNLMNPVRTGLLAASSEEDKDRNEFVVDEVVLVANRNECGISRLEPAALSIRLEGRFTGQDDVDLVGCMSHGGIRRGRNADEHAYFEGR
jgi:hypothetical protein